MTYTPVEVLTVSIFGEEVGAVAASGRGYAFEYAPKWKRRRIELAPVLMPTTSRRRIFTFPGLNEDTYQGRPPMLADSVPDRSATASSTACSPAKVYSLVRSPRSIASRTSAGAAWVRSPSRRTRPQRLRIPLSR